MAIKFAKTEVVYSKSNFFDLEILKSGTPEGVDPSKKEEYLDDN